MERQAVKVSELYPNVFERLSENLELLKGGAVSFDIDAVTQATYFLALSSVSHKVGRFIPKEDLKTYWGLPSIIEKEKGISSDEAMKSALESWNNDFVYLNAPVMPGITGLLRMLSEARVPHVFISSRPPEFTDVTRQWFRYKFPWIDPENVILGRKQGTQGGDFKADVINRLGVVLHVEDALEEAQAILNKTNAKVLIVPQPWNDSDRFENKRVRYLGHSQDNKYTWPVLKFLAGQEGRDFLSHVAHC